MLYNTLLYTPLSKKLQQTRYVTCCIVFAGKRSLKSLWIQYPPIVFGNLHILIVHFEPIAIHRDRVMMYIHRSVSPRGLAKCDERMGIVSPRKIRRYTILLTVSSLSYSILISCLDIYTWGQVKLEKEDKGPLNYLPLYFMYIVIIMMEVQYAIATYNVGQRFLRLNTSLGNILKGSSITNQFRKDLGLGARFIAMIRRTIRSFSQNFESMTTMFLTRYAIL